ncbi:MAG TPA: hypothetical protein ENN22_00830 [bacterium]|nr:hypothetical protein [bacterium]
MYLNETSKKRDTKISAFITLIFLILLGVNFSQAEPADTIKIVAKDQQVLAPSIYQVEFVLNKAISSKAVIRVTIPDEFDISELQVAGSNTINGGFDFKIESRTLVLERSGLGREIPPNEKVDVKFAIVKNPEAAGDNYSFDIEVLDENGLSLIKQQEKISILPKE